MRDFKYFPEEYYIDYFFWIVDKHLRVILTFAADVGKAQNKLNL